MAFSQQKQEFLLAKLGTKDVTRQNETSMRLQEIKQRLKDVYVSEENEKKVCRSRKSKAELEEDSDYVDLNASSVSSHKDRTDKSKKTWVENVPSLNPVVPSRIRFSTTSL